MATDAMSEDGTLKESAAVAVALVALTAFGVFIMYLLSRLDLVDSQWSRALYLLGGIEAIVFTATGFLFGKEVHRAQARSEQERADRMTTEAAKGLTLATLVLTKATTRTAEEDASRNLDEIASAARNLFPEI